MVDAPVKNIRCALSWSSNRSVVYRYHGKRVP